MLFGVAGHSLRTLLAAMLSTLALHLPLCRAIYKSRREKNVCEGPSEEQVMTNAKADWTSEGRGSSAMEHMYEEPEHLEMTAL